MPSLLNSRSDEESLLTKRRVLILDDEASVSRTVSLMAERLGLRAQTCSTLTEFEAALQTFAPDVLLIDLMMPGIDGIEAICRISPLCDAAIYVMSGADKRTYEASREVLRSSHVPIAGFLQKPFSVTELREALNQSPEAVVEATPTAPGREATALLSSSMLAELTTRGEVAPYFQPIFDARTRCLKGFEALLRVEGRSETHFPAEYLDHLANDVALATLVTDVVVKRSLHFLASSESRPDISMSINIFGMQAVVDGFRERLLESCSSFDVDPRRIILELNEAAVCAFNEADMRKITQLRLAGFGLSIDDFGTRNSSLGRLASLPFSELKIDKSFCLALPGSNSSEAIVEACLSIAHKLEMTATAEGVETGEVADILTRMGCDALQGHYFGRALPAQRAVEWMKKGCPLPGDDQRMM